MAEVINRIAFHVFAKCRKSLLSIYPVSTCIPSRSYSRYSDIFHEPIIPKGEQKDVLESEAFKEIELLPVRAALNYHTNSMFLDPRVMKFINYVMDGGQKAVARRIVGDTLVTIKSIQVSKYNRAKPDSKQNIELDPLKIFHAAIDNAKPYIKLSKIRLGASWYQVPQAITDKQAEGTAMKWFVEAGNDKHKGKRFFRTLAEDLIEASQNRGRVINRKIELHKLGEANKAYAHFRWG